MNTLTKLALGLLGQSVARDSTGEALATLALLPPQLDGGLPLMQALQRRESQREFSSSVLPAQTLSNLLWAAAGVNRPELGGRTAPSAMNAQEVDLYVALPEGLYRYDAGAHCLKLLQTKDVRPVTGYQDFVDTAPLDLVFVADYRRMKLVPAKQRGAYANAAAGAMAQNVYLYCASIGLATVIRAWIDREALAKAMGLTQDEELLLAQTVGLPA
ncbi:nitroreductase family protein [Roseateles albus]|uniref:Nitroreductase family protein n=1 Tax=Roseateles albus TaxID=2987525 RepID=A0ABT5KKP4_9BURK|nr:nitroreductase family protein [Roseateles albus]MDC8774445.1 nitroreductase family protein [Roseateles albus]